MSEQPKTTMVFIDFSKYTGTKYHEGKISYRPYILDTTLPGISGMVKQITGYEVHHLNQPPIHISNYQKQKQMIDSIKTLRRAIDIYVQVIILIGSSRALALARTASERSKMFLGLVLKELGTDNPYPNSQDPTNTKIEPTADKADSAEFIQKMKEASEVHTKAAQIHISKIKFLRNEIQLTLDEMDENIMKAEAPSNRAAFWALQSFAALTEAKLWLGMELAEVNKDLHGGEEPEIEKPVMHDHEANTVDASKETDINVDETTKTGTDGLPE